MQPLQKTEGQPASDLSPSDRTRLRILEAANQVLMERGYARSTTRAIAAAAGVNEVTLFRHFGTKLNLFATVIEHYSALPGLQKLMEDCLTGEYRHDVLMLATHFLSGMNRQRETMRLLMCEAHHVPELREVMYQVPQQMRRLLTGYFQQQIRRKAIRQDFDAEIVAQAFFGIVMAINMMRHPLQPGLVSAEEPSEAAIRHFVDIFVEGTIQRQ